MRQPEYSTHLIQGVNAIDLRNHLKPDTFAAIGRPELMTFDEVHTFVEILKLTPDSATAFPRGKWATIQAIQVIEKCARGHRPLVRGEGVT